MIDIDGSLFSGSGTIVRQAVAYAALTGRDVRIRNARARRPRPGLRPQHLRVIQAIRDLVGGSLNGAQIGSQSLAFEPGNQHTTEHAQTAAWLARVFLSAETHAEGQVLTVRGSGVRPPRAGRGGPVL